MNTGSLVNLIYANTKNPTPVVGMGVTELCWTDRNPFEVVKVIDERHILVRALDYKRTDKNGMSDVQDYEYFSNESNPVIKLFRDKRGAWRQRHSDRTLGSTRFLVGKAERYYDFSF